MATYKTPGVYVEEISILPPSVAEVETAIPAFMGFTEKGATPKRISSLKEYEDNFGKAAAEKNITVTVQEDAALVVTQVTDVTIDADARSKNVMYYALQLYFVNGGGPCYIIPAGNFKDSDNNALDAFKEALHTSSKEDEPTLLVFPDAPFLLEADTYYDLMTEALGECARLGDRFTIIDVLNSDNDTRASVKRFRDRITNNEDVKKYGAAYFPYLNTNLSYIYNSGDVIVRSANDQNAADEVKTSQERLEAVRADLASARSTSKNLKKEADKEGATDKAKADSQAAAERVTVLEQKLRDAEAAFTAAGNKVTTQTFDRQSNLVQKQIEKKIGELDVQLTPCAAVAGVYASVDSTRGVWKAPANVTLNYVTSTAAKITDEDQKDLNIDVDAGKSVNAIRPFVGMGIKIWGARTLDGNDNEWRYVNVRRFFNMVEESVKKSTYWAVFEPNDINTWTRVRAMIENYLLLKWKDGALAGVKPDDAFYVRVGLGQTMSPQDVLEGRMIVEIGLAAVRPAEFIILKFSHLVQKS